MTSLRPSLSRWIAPALLSLAAVSAAQAADVGVSIGFSQPGIYGRVDIGRYPQPVLIAPQPVYVARPAYRDPVYLWVPVEHRRDWRHHCSRYGACAAPVYFVDDGWYRSHVIVHHHHRDRDRWHHERHHDHPGRGHGHGRGHRD